MAYSSLDDPKRLDHPVWVVYNLQRTACLNVKYYGHKLRELERESRIVDLTIAVAAPTSAIAGLAIWKTPLGQEFWSWVPSLASVLVFIKAAAKSSARLKELEKRVNAYQSLLFDMKEIADKVLTERKYSAASQKLYETAQRRYGAVFRMPPDKKDKKLILRYEREVAQEMPAQGFFIPEE